MSAGLHGDDVGGDADNGGYGAGERDGNDDCKYDGSDSVIYGHAVMVAMMCLMLMIGILMT